jgi:hypothetical protein
MLDGRHSNVRRQTFACSHRAPKTACNFSRKNRTSTVFWNSDALKQVAKSTAQTSSAQRWLRADDGLDSRRLVGAAELRPRSRLKLKLREALELERREALNDAARVMFRGA